MDTPPPIVNQIPDIQPKRMGLLLIVFLLCAAVAAGFYFYQKLQSQAMNSVVLFKPQATTQSSVNKFSNCTASRDNSLLVASVEKGETYNSATVRGSVRSFNSLGNQTTVTVVSNVGSEIQEFLIDKDKIVVNSGGEIKVGQAVLLSYLCNHKTGGNFSITRLVLLDNANQ